MFARKMLLITLIETLTDIFALLPRVDVDKLQKTCRVFRETVNLNQRQFAWRLVEAAAVRDENSVSYVVDMVPECEPVPGVPTRTLEFRGRLSDSIRFVFQALQWARVEKLATPTVASLTPLLDKARLKVPCCVRRKERLTFQPSASPTSTPPVASTSVVCSRRRHTMCADCIGKPCAALVEQFLVNYTKN